MTRLSFNLVNEPGVILPQTYCRVVRRAVAAIRREDSARLIIADGIRWGREPVFDLADLDIAQSTRGYDPMEVSHYKAPWVAGQCWPKPTWPIVQGDNLFDTQRLRRYLEYEQLLGKKGNEVLDRQWVDRNCIEPWRKLAAKGVGVLVGEWGAFNKTPHDVVLAWARDFSASGKRRAGAGLCGTSEAPSASSTASGPTSPTRTFAVTSLTVGC